MVLVVALLELMRMRVIIIGNCGKGGGGGAGVRGGVRSVAIRRTQVSEVRKGGA